MCHHAHDVAFQVFAEDVILRGSLVRDAPLSLCPPLDVELVWHTHMLNPLLYIEVCVCGLCVCVCVCDVMMFRIANMRLARSSLISFSTKNKRKVTCNAQKQHLKASARFPTRCVFSVCCCVFVCLFSVCYNQFSPLWEELQGKSVPSHCSVV